MGGRFDDGGWGRLSTEAEPPGMSTNTKTPETPDQSLSNAELAADLARRRAAAIAQRLAAFKRMSGLPAGNPVSGVNASPAGNSAHQDSPNPETPAADLPREALSGQGVKVDQPAEVVPPRSRLLDPAAPKIPAYIQRDADGRLHPFVQAYAIGQ